MKSCEMKSCEMRSYEQGRRKNHISDTPGIVWRCFHEDPENGIIGLGFLTFPADSDEIQLSPQPFYRCALTLAGSPALTDESGSTRILSRGNVFWLFPGQGCRLSFPAGSAVRFYQICIGAATYRALDSMRFFNDTPVFSIKIRSYLESWMQALVTELEATPAKQLHEVWLGIQKFLIQLHSEGKKELTRDDTALIDSAKQLLFDACLSRSLSFPAVAASLGLSYETFRKLFKQKTGRSPLRFVLENRFHYAQRLLTEGSSVRETAAAVGYADPYVFSKQFKKYIGHPPAYYKPDRQ